MIVSKEDAVGSIQGAVSKERMPEASDKGSQPYSRAYGYGEMAGARIAPNNISLPLGRRHGLRMSLT